MHCHIWIVFVIQSLLRKVNPIDAEQISQLVMDAMFKMLDSSIGKTGGVQDDAIATVGVVIQCKCIHR